MRLGVSKYIKMIKKKIDPNLFSKENLTSKKKTVPKENYNKNKFPVYLQWCDLFNVCLGYIYYRSFGHQPHR